MSFLKFSTPPPGPLSVCIFSLSLTFGSVSLLAASGTLQTQQYGNQFGKVTVEALVTEQDNQLQRSYKLTTAQHPAPIELQIQPGDLQLSSGNPLFDALFTLNQQERHANSVQEITDWGFNDQQALACPCFETGAKWHYVWTRDLSYSLDLGLAYLDPQRAQQSLLFKTSKVRPELVASGITATEVALQDTGSGGSWPVSSDRVVWILAASNLNPLPQTDSNSAQQLSNWQQQWYPIARNTLLQDRQYLYSQTLGLYRGETSFLDWREQTYPSWTANDTLYLAQSYALSTNVLHYVALKRTAAAAATLEPALAAQFAQWADALKLAINQQFWLTEQGLYASYIGEQFNPLQVQHYDLLGLALAINHDVASSEQAQQILAQYPLTQAGPPVIFPALPNIPIYHNRAIWPFVSGYALRAAKKQQHSALFHKISMSLFQGAAFNLSNMENLEWLSQQAHVEDGALSGPVINSQRQLWSVAAYQDMVVGNLFGLEVGANQLTINPFIPATLVKDLKLAKQLQLQHLPLAALKLNIQLNLQGDARPNQVYLLQKLSINGLDRPLTAKHQLQLALSDFDSEQNDLVLELAPATLPEQSLTLLKISDDDSKANKAQQAALFSPVEPELQLSLNSQGQPELLFDSKGAPSSSFTLYKNGSPLALKRHAKSYVDSKANAAVSQCYALTQTDKHSQLVSLPSRTLCTEGAVQQFIAGEGLISDDAPISQYLGKPVFKLWGKPEQQLQLQYSASHSGPQRLALQYYIDNGPINTGITAVVKQLKVQCGNDAVQTSSLVLPHLATATELGQSSQAYFYAKAGETCQLQIQDGFNMSYLQHFTLYTGGKGGRSGPLNQAVIHAAVIRPAAL